MYSSLTDLQNQLTAVLLNQCHTVATKEADSSYVEPQNPETNMNIQKVTLLQAHQPLQRQLGFWSVKSQSQLEPQKVNLGKRGKETLSLLHLHGVIVKHRQVCHFA